MLLLMRAIVTASQAVRQRGDNDGFSAVSLQTLPLQSLLRAARQIIAPHAGVFGSR